MHSSASLFQFGFLKVYVLNPIFFDFALKCYSYSHFKSILIMSIWNFTLCEISYLSCSLFKAALSVMHTVVFYYFILLATLLCGSKSKLLGSKLNHRQFMYIGLHIFLISWHHHINKYVEKKSCKPFCFGVPFLPFRDYVQMCLSNYHLLWTFTS